MVPRNWCRSCPVLIAVSAGVLLLAFASTASAQGLARAGGDTGGGRSAGAGGSGGQGCAAAVATAAKDCVLGYGGSLAGCAQLGAQAPGGTARQALAAAARPPPGLGAKNWPQSAHPATHARGKASLSEARSCRELFSRAIADSCPKDCPAEHGAEKTRGDSARGRGPGK